MKTVRRSILRLVLAAVALSACSSSDDGTDLPATPTGSITLAAGTATASLQQGSAITIPVSVTRVGAFSGPVTLGAELLPTGVTATFAPVSLASGVASSTLTLSATSSAALGTSNITVRATGSGVTDQTVTVALTVAAAPVGADFTLIATPATVTIEPGGSGMTSIEVRAVGGFGSAVALTTSSLPAGVTATFAQILSTNAVLTFAATSAAVPQTVNVVVTGTAAGLAPRSTTVALTIAVAPGFGVTFASSVATIASGGSGSLTATITRRGGFTGTVNFTTAGLPAGITATPNPVAVTGNSVTVNLNVASSVAAGTYGGSLIGNATGLTAVATTFTVTVSGGGTGAQSVWQFCDPIRLPVFFAYRDGTTGTWTRVAPTAGNVYTYSMTQPVGGVVYVYPENTGFRTMVLFRGREELTSIGAGQCATYDPNAKTLSGTIAALGTSESAYISHGNAAAFSIFGMLNYTLTGVRSGAQDLVAVRNVLNSTTGTQSPNSLIVRRALNVAAGGTIAPLDFAAAEAFAPATATVTIGNLGSDNSTANSFLLTTNSVSPSVIGSSGANTSITTQTIYGLPGARLATGDLHQLAVFGTNNDGTISRGAYLNYRDVGNKTVTLGPVLTAPLYSGGPGVIVSRPRLEGTVQSEYSEAMFATFSQRDNAATVSSSKAYLNGSTQYDLQIPDLVPVAGYNSQWGLSIGNNTSYTLTGSGVPNGAAFDGQQYKLASRSAGPLP